MNSLYANIKKQRLALGLTQDDVARMIGYKNKSTIAKIETGKSDLPQSRIADFARVLSTTPEMLMGWERADGKLVTEEQVSGCLSTDFRSLRPLSKKKAVLNALEKGKKELVLKVTDDCMYPEYLQDDIVIIRVQDKYKTGDDCAVVCAGKSNVIIRKVLMAGDKVLLQPSNNSYKPLYYSGTDFDKVNILGKVVEIRRQK